MDVVLEGGGGGRVPPEVGVLRVDDGGLVYVVEVLDIDDNDDSVQGVVTSDDDFECE